MCQNKDTDKNEENIKPDEKTDISAEKKIDVYKRLNAYRPPDNLLKKHPCKDCFNCLWCSDARCEVCLRAKGCPSCKKSQEKPDPAS